jgi:hypothetical protein
MHNTYRYENSYRTEQVRKMYCVIIFTQ